MEKVATGGIWVEKVLYLGHCIIEFLQYYVSLRTMTAEIIRWRSRPKGGIWIEKVLSWEVHNNTGISRRTMMMEIIRWRRWPTGGIWIKKCGLGI